MHMSVVVEIAYYCSDRRSSMLVNLPACLDLTGPALPALRGNKASQEREGGAFFA